MVWVQVGGLPAAQTLQPQGTSHPLCVGWTENKYLDYLQPPAARLQPNSLPQPTVRPVTQRWRRNAYKVDLDLNVKMQILTKWTLVVNGNIMLHVSLAWMSQLCRKNTIGACTVYHQNFLPLLVKLPLWQTLLMSISANATQFWPSHRCLTAHLWTMWPKWLNCMK